MVSANTFRNILLLVCDSLQNQCINPQQRFKIKKDTSYDPLVQQQNLSLFIDFMLS